MSLVSQFNGKKVLVVGDVMLDRFIWGRSERISPEAPVPVVQVEKESYFPGGAANVARNLVPFAGENGRVYVCGHIGEDSAGRVLAESLAESGVETTTLHRDNDFPTICKTRVLAQQQQVVRIDQEQRSELTSLIEDSIIDSLRPVITQVDAMVLEDYSKGFLSQNLVNRLIKEALDAEVLVTVDPHPGSKTQWNNVYAVKPNRKEAFIAAELRDDHPQCHPTEDKYLLEAGKRLQNKWGCKVILITLGEQGMMLLEEGREPHFIETRSKEVFDVSGAGDTAIAIFTLALCSGGDPKSAAELANLASGRVVGKLGTAALTKEELIELEQASPIS